MATSLLFFAAADARDDLLLTPRRDGFRLDLTDTLLVLGVVFVLAALLFFWAFYIRKRPTQKNGTPGLVKTPRRHEPSENDDPRRIKVRRRRRRHHPDNFPRNPTLGETGGLPPVRSEEPQSPPQ